MTNENPEGYNDFQIQKLNEMSMNNAKSIATRRKYELRILNRILESEKENPIDDEYGEEKIRELIRLVNSKYDEMLSAVTNSSVAKSPRK